MDGGRAPSAGRHEELRAVAIAEAKAARANLNAKETAEATARSKADTAWKRAARKGENANADEYAAKNLQEIADRHQQRIEPHNFKEAEKRAGLKAEATREKATEAEAEAKKLQLDADKAEADLETAKERLSLAEDHLERVQLLETDGAWVAPLADAGPIRIRVDKEVHEHTDPDVPVIDTAKYSKMSNVKDTSSATPWDEPPSPDTAGVGGERSVPHTDAAGTKGIRVDGETTPHTSPGATPKNKSAFSNIFKRAPKPTKPSGASRDLNPGIGSHRAAASAEPVPVWRVSVDDSKITGLLKWVRNDDLPLAQRLKIHEELLGKYKDVMTPEQKLEQKEAFKKLFDLKPDAHSTGVGITGEQPRTGQRGADNPTMAESHQPGHDAASADATTPKVFPGEGHTPGGRTVHPEAPADATTPKAFPGTGHKLSDKPAHPEAPADATTPKAFPGTGHKLSDKPARPETPADATTPHAFPGAGHKLSDKPAHPETPADATTPHAFPGTGHKLSDGNAQPKAPDKSPALPSDEGRGDRTTTAPHDKSDNSADTSDLSKDPAADPNPHAHSTGGGITSEQLRTSQRDTGSSTMTEPHQPGHGAASADAATFQAFSGEGHRLDGGTVHREAPEGTNSPERGRESDAFTDTRRQWDRNPPELAPRPSGDAAEAHSAAERTAQATEVTDRRAFSQWRATHARAEAARGAAERATADEKASAAKAEADRAAADTKYEQFQKTPNEETLRDAQTAEKTARTSA
ncbi:hypothetical protein ACWGJY_21340, partial [Streptomyces sp. NPDC054765]